MEKPEDFKDIPGYEGLYAVSKDGRVWSYPKYKHNGKLLKLSNIKGYLAVGLLKITRKQKHYFVHRLVALTFIPNPENKLQINHIDGNKLNNKLSNLEWVTPAENMKHAIAHDLLKTKLTEKDIKEIRLIYKKGNKKFSTTALAKKFNVSQGLIWFIVNRWQWNHV